MSAESDNGIMRMRLNHQETAMGYRALAYLPAMFATSMLFLVIYAACVVSWSLLPDLPPHAAMLKLFPQVRLLTTVSFLFGLVCSIVYGLFVAGVFVLSYNLWGRCSAFLMPRETPAP
jgi:ABC-type multidrug transport system permease subunit